jgi:hypothetical protein
LAQTQAVGGFRRICFSMRQQRRDCILDTQPQRTRFRRAPGASFSAIFEEQRIEIRVGTGCLRSFDRFRERDLVDQTAEYDRAAKILFDLLGVVGAKMGERHALIRNSWPVSCRHARTSTVMKNSI